MPQRHSSLRKHSTVHRVYIPNSARDNQYLLANFDITEQLIAAIDPQFSTDAKLPYKTFYRQLRNKLFALCEQQDLNNVHFIANDKAPLVRFNNEAQAIETQDKILFFYNPEYHQGQKYFYDFDQRAKRISILFLATGDTVRINSGAFHQQVSNLLNDFSSQLQLAPSAIHVRDHQHITYDLFSKNKEKLDTQSHKFRSIAMRYLTNDVELPSTHTALTYVIADIAVTANIRKLANIDYESPAPYNPLYTMITDAFVAAMQQNNLSNGAVIANGLMPLVRFSSNEEMSVNKGCQMLGYDPAQSGCGIISKWNADEFVDTVRLVFMATDKDCTDRGYGKYVNQIIKVLETFADKLQIDGNNEQLMVRFHQHIAYRL